MAELPIFKFDELLARLGGSQAALVRAVALFDQSLADWQVALPDAVAAGDPERLRRLAHQIKGALLTFAAPRAAEVARRIEESANDRRLDGVHQALDELRDELRQVRAEAARRIADAAHR